MCVPGPVTRVVAVSLTCVITVYAIQHVGGISTRLVIVCKGHSGHMVLGGITILVIHTPGPATIALRAPPGSTPLFHAGPPRMRLGAPLVAPIHIPVVVPAAVRPVVCVAVAVSCCHPAIPPKIQSVSLVPCVQTISLWYLIALLPQIPPVGVAPGAHLVSIGISPAAVLVGALNVAPVSISHSGIRAPA